MRRAPCISPYVGTEHILLGLIQEKDGLAAQALARLNITYDGVVQTIRQVVTIDEETECRGICPSRRA